ncbi:MAG: MBL fold metallo-hydrolase [Clostridia bacterium]|nr:MBL fold metallo-hydrolase [Clostridia bacterium]MBQ9921125.1 MBL fold metallo-hydrolase [Clostridia bacterium]
MAKIIQYATEASFFDGPFGGGAPWLSAGMGYLIVTDGGKLIAIDGGHEADCAGFAALIEKLGGEVDTWILTHPHRDHYRALRGICLDEALLRKVKVGKIVYRFPESFIDDEGEPIDYALDHMNEIFARTGAERITPSEGDEIFADGLNIKFLCTPTDDGPTNCSPNDLSLIFTVSGGTGRAVFTGDADERSLEHVYKKYKDELKADVLQMPHHGLCDTGHRGFYGAVGADTLLIPISKAGHRCMRSGIYGDRTDLICGMEDGAEKVYLAYRGTTEIEIII